MEQQTNKYTPRYSYTKLSCLDQCPFKYKLQYIDKNYFFEDTLATELGTLVHYIEEQIARSIIAKQPIDYQKLKTLFVHADIHPEENDTDLIHAATTNVVSNKDANATILGCEILSSKYQQEFYEVDKDGFSYYNKCQDYLNTGIYQLENFLKENPDLEIFDVEHEFLVPFNDVLLYGFIDRIYKNKKTGEFIVEDIKTKGKPYPQEQLITPLQFVTYAIGLKEELGLTDYPTEFYYCLPFVGIKQQAGTPGFINRGIKKLNKLLEKANGDEFAPKPGPLCHWCAFCPTNPNQPEAAKYKCPYFSLWTPGGSAKGFDTLNKWEGNARHEIILKKFLLEQQGPGKDLKIVVPDFDF